MPKNVVWNAGTNPKVTITFGKTRFLDIPSIQDADDDSAVKTVESLLALIALQQVDVFQILGRKQFEMNKEANWRYPIACCYLLLLRSCLHFVVYIQTPHGPRPKQMGKAEEIINRMERIVKGKKWTE